MSKITVLFFWVSFGSHISGSIRSNYLGLMWTQGLKWAPVWTGIAYWWSYFGLNCAQMAPGGVESEFGMQGWIGTVQVKQIFLIFSTLFASHRNELRLTTASYPDVSLSMKMCAQWKEGRRHPFHGPFLFITSNSRFALASTIRKTKRPRRKLGLQCTLALLVNLITLC